MPADRMAARSSRRVPFCVVLLALVCNACSDAPDGPTSGVQVQIRDSAGVRIVEYAGTPDSVPPFRFSAEPLYRHGGRPGDYQFHYISSTSPRQGRFLPDGSAVISDAENDEVVLLGPDGALDGILARRGDSPGEVRSAMPLVLSQDSIVVHDGWNRRFTLFVDGALAGTYGAHRADNLHMLGGDGADGVLMATESYSALGNEPGWATGHLVRYDFRAAVLDTIGSFRVFHRSPGQYDNPFETYGSATAVRGHIVTGSTDVAALTWRRPDGSVAQILRWNPEPVYPTWEHWDQFVDFFRRDYQKQPGASAEMAREAALRLSERYRLEPDKPLPLYRAKLADSAGRLWLEEYEPGNRHEGVFRLTVIAADGTWLGTVTAPERFILLDATADRVLGRVVDELGVQHAVLYGLEATPARPDEAGAAVPPDPPHPRSGLAIR